jgi:methionine-rich copper-binding protein CopC
VLATGSTLSYTENNTATAINTVITVADADSTALALGTVSITGGYVTGQDVLSFANTGAAAMGNISGSFNGTTGVMTLTSVSNSATLAQWQAALRAVAYSNTSDAPSTAARTVSYVVKDGALNSAVVTSTINVTAVNDAPVNTVPVAQTTPEDTDKVITGLSVLDVDATGSITVTLGVTNGTLALLTGTGVTLTGNNSTSITLTGTQGAINTLLATANAVTYKPTPDFYGNATLTMTSSDGTLIDIDSVAITVAAVNDAPVLADSNLNLATVDPVTGNPVGAVGSLVSSFMGGVSDVDAGALQGMAITGVDTTKGTVWFSTNGGSAWTEVTQTLSNTNALLIGSDADNRLYFKPTAGAPDGQVSAAISFRAWDRTTGTEGSFVSTTLNGNTTAFSIGMETIAQTIYHDEPPTLVGSNPSDNGFMMAVSNNITLNFSEAIVKGTGLIELYRANGTLVQSFDVVSSGLVTGWGTANLTINPTNNLLASTGYYIKIASTAVKDTTGNAYAGISDATTLNFRTTDEDGGIPPTAMSGSGYVVSSAGDVNGDGFDDVMVGVPTLRNEPYTGSYLAGGAYVIYGNAAGTLPALPMNTATGVNASIAASVGFKISSAMSAESRFGATVSGIGDVNGDGFDDVMMGLGGTNARGFVVYGGATNAGVSIDTAGNINNSQGFKIALASGFDSTAAFGSVVTGLGDVNGDGVADFGVRVISSLANSFSYVLYGSKTNQSDLVVTGEMNQYAIGDASRGYRLAGLVTAVGDMNNDGMADVVATTYNNNDNSSAATIYYSNANGTANTTNAAYSVTGTISNSPMRQVTSMGDVNGDGIADLAVLSSNHVFVVYGQTGTTNVALSTLSATQGYKIVLPTGSSHYDWISSAGDVNGDGLADVIIGKQNTYANFAMVVYGNATGTDVQLSHILGYSSGYNVSDDALPASQGFKISSVPGGEIGYRVSNAGDFNGDGLADLIVGGLAAQDGVFGIVLGGTQFVTNAVQGSGTVNGTSGSEALFGSTANDTLTGGGGVDRFFAGEGNDTIVLTATDVTNLANVTTGQTVKTSTDGGGGFDTLRLTGGANLNLTTINNVGGMGLEEHSRIESIERIDMATDTASNTLSLQARDVRDMAGMNLIRIGSVSADGKTWSNVTGTALSATTKFHQLVVEGGSNDNLTLGTDLGFWSVTGTVNNGTHNYTVYQNAGSNAQVLVRAGVVVTNNDSVAPVVLDLNRDGDLSYSQTLMDVNGDGQLDQTAWAGAQDGVLVWDKYADGVVHDNSQYAFSQYGAAGSTDLQGLAAGFDTNHDGEFNAQDAKFAEFKVWQDGNGNGVSDVGEVRSLAEVGIEAIQLSSDGVVRAPAVGVQEAGRSTAQLADGGEMLVADAAFAFQTVPQLDFAGFVAQAQAESKAQPLPAQASVKLFLYDMIQGATAAEQGIGALFAAEGEGLIAPEPQHLGFHMDLLAEHLLQPPQS